MTFNPDVFSPNDFEYSALIRVEILNLNFYLSSAFVKRNLFENSFYTTIKMSATSV